MLLVKPFDQTHSNLIEFINDFFFSIAWLSLTFLDSEYKWNNVFEYIYLAILAAGNIVASVIAFIHLGITIKKYIHKCRKKHTRIEVYRFPQQNANATTLNINQAPSKNSEQEEEKNSSILTPDI